MPATKPNSVERKSYKFDVKAVQRDGDEIDTATLLVSAFGNVDDEGDVMEKGAFKKTISERVPAGKVKFVDNHTYDIKSTYGTIQTARERDEGLEVKVNFASTPDAQQAAQKIAEGHISQFSIGYIVHEKSFEDVDGTRVRRIKEVELKEVTGSAVVVNDQTEAVSVNTKSYKSAIEELDKRDVISKKSWPSEAPFDDFSGCVDFYHGHPDVDNPGSFCAQIRSGFQEFIPKEGEKSFDGPVGAHGDMELKNFQETSEVVSTKALLGGLEVKAVDRAQVEKIVRIMGVALRDRLEDRMDELPKDLLDDILDRVMSSVSNESSGEKAEAEIDEEEEDENITSKGELDEEKEEEQMRDKAKHKDEEDDKKKQAKSVKAKFIETKEEFLEEELNQAG